MKWVLGARKCAHGEEASRLIRETSLKVQSAGPAQHESFNDVLKIRQLGSRLKVTVSVVTNLALFFRADTV